MKKITEQAARAFVNGYDFKLNNTEVVVDGPTSKTHPVKMYLHGNLIAERQGHTVYLTDCNWQTATTKERLNSILSLLNEPKIYQKDFTWYWKDGELFPSNQFNEI